VVHFTVGANQPEAGADQGPLRSDIAHSRIGDHSGQPVVGGDGQHCDHGLSGVAVAAGRRRQTVTDLDAAVLWLALEPDPPDGQSVGQPGDAVVTERPLLSPSARGTKERSYGDKVTLEREIGGPGVGGPRASSDDPFCLCHVYRVQLQAGGSHVGHDTSEAAPYAKRQSFQSHLRTTGQDWEATEVEVAAH
jgi:hypothetical protein